MFKKITYLRLTKPTQSPGAECQIIREKTGIWKFYYSEDEAKRAYERQKLFHKHGLGPRIFSKIINVLHTNAFDDLIFLWGFKSQKATHVGCISVLQEDKIIDEARKKTKKRIHDSHPANYGKIKNKWVLIDFGDCTFA